MRSSISRRQCVVKCDGEWQKVKASHVSEVVYDKRTGDKLGILIEPNPNTNMLRLKTAEGKTVTLK